MCPKRTKGRCIFHLNQSKCVPDVRISNQAASATVTRHSPFISLNSFYFSSQRRAEYTAPFTEFTHFVNYLQSIKWNFGLHFLGPRSCQKSTSVGNLENINHDVGDSQNTNKNLFATTGVQDSNNYTFRPFLVVIITLYLPSFRSVYNKLNRLFYIHWTVHRQIMEILYITNKMRLVMIFIVNNVLHVSGFNAHHQELMNCICSLQYR